MCEKCDNYVMYELWVDVNEHRTFNRIEHEKHLYLVPQNDWTRIKIKVQEKMENLLKLRDTHFRELAHRYLNCSEFKDQELFNETLKQLETNDLRACQLVVGRKQLEFYLKENDYYEGRKQSLRVIPYGITQKIRCKNCGHSMYNHQGQYNETDCYQQGSECKKKCKSLVLEESKKVYLADLCKTLIPGEQEWVRTHEHFTIDENGFFHERETRYDDPLDEDDDDDVAEVPEEERLVDDLKDEDEVELPSGLDVKPTVEPIREKYKTGLENWL